MIRKKWNILFSLLIALSCHNLVGAAEVPTGVKLAKNQQLVRNNSTEPESLDPHKSTGEPEANITRDLLEGLVNLGPQGEIVPGVATSWHSSDMKTWIFHLRKDAKWSNGDPVTAHDFVYSWRRLADPKTASPYASYLEYIKLANQREVIAGLKKIETLGITAIDDHTLQISLSQPISYLAKMMYHTSLFPVHKATVEKYQDAWTKPENYVGNGAFKLHKWVVNERIIAIRNPTYWDNKNTILEQVTFLTINDRNSEVNRYLSNDIDITNASVPIDYIKKLRQERPHELFLTPTNNITYLEMNIRQAPFDDPRVRKALAMTVDREILVQQILQRGVVAYTMNSSSVYDDKVELPKWVDWTENVRIAQARKLLAAAGYSEKNPLKFTILYNTDEVHKRILLAISNIWKHKLGVEATLENLEWKIYLSRRQSEQFQMARAGWIPDYIEPSANLNIMLSNGNSNTGYNSTTFDKILSQALSASDDNARTKYYIKAEKQLIEDMPIIPLFHQTEARLVKPYVVGLTPYNLMYRTIYTKDLYIINH